MNLEKSFFPRKTRKFSKIDQAVDHHPNGEWLNQYSAVICFVFFVDKLRSLG